MSAFKNIDLNQIINCAFSQLSSKEPAPGNIQQRHPDMFHWACATSLEKVMGTRSSSVILGAGEHSLHRTSKSLPLQGMYKAEAGSM